MNMHYKDKLMSMVSIPIFYACDDNYAKYMMVSIKSLIMNSSKLKRYHIYVLHTGLSIANKEKIESLADYHVEITFVDVTEKFKTIEKSIVIRDYFSSTTYYRLFLSEMFPYLDKALYIDSDTILTQDVYKLYKHELGDCYIGAIRDQVIAQTDTFTEYSRKVLGIDEASYFNAGVVLINCKQFRKKNVLKQFINLLNIYTFCVAQDQDYLNIICKNKVFWIDNKWNVQAFGKLTCPKEDISLVHYNLNNKPWHYKDCHLAEYFWKYAEVSPDYEAILKDLENYTPEKKKQDESDSIKLINMAESEISRDDNYIKLYGDNEDKSIERRVILKKIEEYESKGIFDKDVEDDPPSKELKPNEIDYFRKSIKAKFRTKYAFSVGKWLIGMLTRKKQFVIKDIKGMEHLKELKSGAVITCNHFNAFDSFAMQVMYDESGIKKRKFYRVIKEGNYTNFPGIYGLLMRNCNTLPLSSNSHTMRKFYTAVENILWRGHLILMYPEQSMWWNYRKPKPLKRGAFTIAASSKVPVLPCFITMEDTDTLDPDGFPVQAYTIHISEAIYPDKTKTKKENIANMMDKNFNVWKDIYESTYGILLTYASKKDNQNTTN